MKRSSIQDFCVAVVLGCAASGLVGCTTFGPSRSIVNDVPDNERVLLIADTYSKQGHYERAEALYAEVLQSAPASQRAKDGLAKIARLTSSQPTSSVVAKKETPMPESVVASVEKSIAQTQAAAQQVASTPVAAVGKPVKDPVFDLPVLEIAPEPPATEQTLAVAEQAVPLDQAVANVEEVFEPFDVPEAMDARVELVNSRADQEAASEALVDVVAVAEPLCEFFDVPERRGDEPDFDLGSVVAAAVARDYSEVESVEEVELVSEAVAATASTSASDAIDLTDSTPVETVPTGWMSRRNVMLAADVATPDIAETPDRVELPAFVEQLQVVEQPQPVEHLETSLWRASGNAPPVSRRDYVTELMEAKSRLAENSQDISGWKTFDSLLTSLDPAAKSFTILTLGELPEPCHSKTVQRLRTLVATEQDDEVKAAAVLALGGLGGAASAAIPVLQEVVLTGGEQSRAAATVTLACLDVESVD